MTTMFHVTVDDSRRAFWLDGTAGPNSMRLHYEIVLHSRATGVRLREHNIFAQSPEAALAEVRGFLPGYEHVGAWTGRREA